MLTDTYNKALAIPVESDDRLQSEDYDKLFKFEKVQPKLKKLIKDFESRKDEVKSNREIRNIDLSVDALRKSKKLKSDETMLPQRIIDTNIRREMPPFIAYLKQSKRLVTFTAIEDPHLVVDDIENDFTRGLTYSGWEIPHFKNLDGTKTHGWDSMEVEYDLDKPLHVGLVHIGADKLIYDLKSAENIQDCEIVLIEHPITVSKLKSFTSKFDFDKQQVEKIVGKDEDSTEDKNIIIYKKYCKYEDVVYISWFSDDGEADDWLKSPEKLKLGIFHLESVERVVTQPTQIPLYEDDGETLTGEYKTEEVEVIEIVEDWVDTDINGYPVFILPYDETEQPLINDHKGRVFKDKHKQEAMTTNITAFTNGLVRSSKIFASPKTESTNKGKLKSIDLSDGKVIEEPMDFWSLPSPTPTMLALAQYLDVNNSQEVGQPANAVMNRKDSRKTATENIIAKEEQGLLNSVQVTLFSTFIREIYSFAWTIVQSQALRGLITFIPNRPNREQILGYTFDIRAAGDTDVIKKAELLAQYQMFWPIVQSTSVAGEFLGEMLKMAFGERGERYAAKLAEGERTKVVIGSLVESLKAALSPEEIQALPPDKQQILGQLITEATAIVTGGQEEQPQPTQ